MDIKAARFDLVSHDGVKIAAFDHGGTGEPIVFLHYLGGMAQLWHPVIKHHQKELVDTIQQFYSEIPVSTFPAK
ncbi:alpha/beta fold hydrolase [Fictibacillus barbaricus]|uniref:Uncharacterized protein n=1 Tax=Fictibacillus barbaricus TaxID=182136 RepID=A0ABU1TX50_9BACL|nr:hypothetical protein [Fictibacillus barbaricus]MDR7071807.1 hypothetical protein [Fictibacillus barbaricus]